FEVHGRSATRKQTVASVASGRSETFSSGLPAVKAPTRASIRIPVDATRQTLEECIRSRRQQSSSICCDNACAGRGEDGVVEKWQRSSLAQHLGKHAADADFLRCHRAGST